MKQQGGDRLFLQGVHLSGEVLVRAFGKRRLRTRYASWQLFLPDGAALAAEALEQWVEDYYLTA
jgi:hypothetical protein